MFTVAQEAVAGKAWMAGSGASGQLGLGASAMKDITSFNAIQQVVQDKYPESLYPRFIKDVSAGWWHSCFVARNATNRSGIPGVLHGGLNNYGQLGNSWVSTKVSLPVPVTANSSAFRSSSFLAVECGPDYSVALSTEGGDCGLGDAGQAGSLGIMTKKNVKCSSQSQSCARSQESVLRVPLLCRFDVEWRDLWLGSQRPTSTGICIHKHHGDPASHDCLHRCFHDSSWGSSCPCGCQRQNCTHGEAGRWDRQAFPTTKPVRIKAEWSIATPTVIPALSQVKVRSIAAGHRHSLVLDNCGTVYAFGSDAFGQLGQDKVTPFSKKTRSYVPLVVPAIAKRKLVGVWGCSRPLQQLFRFHRLNLRVSVPECKMKEWKGGRHPFPVLRLGRESTSVLWGI